MRNVSKEELENIVRTLKRSCKSFGSSSRCAQCVVHLACECLQHEITIDTVASDDSHLPKGESCFDQDGLLNVYTSLGFLCLKCKANGVECSWCPVDSAHSLLKLAITDFVNL